MMEDMEEATEEKFQLYELIEGDGKRHSVLKVPRSLPSEYCTEEVAATQDVFNILMADVSGSMYSYWPHVVIGWEASIKEKLTGSGKTKIYVFGSYVDFVREGTDLYDKDNTGGGTDLTKALKTVREEVENCSESNVRVFIVTDGGHGGGEPQPEFEINKMKPPVGKTVSVYLLGISHAFPVNYSIDMRSHMHNGNANIPSLYWAKDAAEIGTQMAAIGLELNSALVKLDLNEGGYILPGLDKTSSVHLGEWIYFEQPPKDLPSLSVSVNEDEHKAISTTVEPANMRHLLDYVFRQWNSVLIQQHRKKAHVPHEVFDLMESLFNHFDNILKKETPTGNDIKSRMVKKRIKSYALEFKTLMNQSKTVIDVEGKFLNELELAETILKSTVTNRKFDIRNLKLKGHDREDYVQDLESFKRLYEKAKPAIKALPPPAPEHCCTVTITSTLTDLQDPEFHLMFEETKFDLLKSFVMTGIPVYAPVRDASQINPWTLVIKHILVTPYAILSQQVLEQYAAVDLASVGTVDKDVILQQDNEKTRFNAIIPLVPVSAAEVLKPLVLSNIYAMMATFCILKNPHIVDYNAHLAALGCAWIRTVREFPVKQRPEFASDRLESVVATANLYMDRPSIKRYIDALINNPKQALMTESVDEFDGKNLKCESLIKPTFFMYLKKDKFSTQQVSDVTKLMLFEYIGRCLSNYKTDEADTTPFTDFFCAQLSDEEKRKAWLEKHSKAIIDAYQANQGNLLEKFYTLDDMIPGLKKFVAEKVASLTATLLDELTIAIDMNKIKKLSNFGTCGDIRWASFQFWAQEMGIPEEETEKIFSPAQVTAYVYQALQIRNSRERLATDMPSPDSALEMVNKRVVQENIRTLRATILKEVQEFSEARWREAYMTAHRPLVMPLTQQQVVEAAQARGIQVTEETFSTVYRYNDRLGLIRNACQIPGCPHYLKPHNNFNQHLSIEREQGNFPHALHVVSREFCGQGVTDVIKEVVSGKHAGTKKRKQPPPPPPDCVETLSVQLEDLVKIYAKKHCPTSNEADIDGGDEFFDCRS